MSWQSPAIERSDLERLLHEFEVKLARVTRSAARTKADAPRAFENVSDTIATGLADLAERIRGRARSVDVAQLGDDALQFGNKTLRKLTHEVEQRPLVTLAIAAGVGALVCLLLARRD
jgi:ElaB/YqjD/DUF883 family membrane-anchored ribosome-binding protein